MKTTTRICILIFAIAMGLLNASAQTPPKATQTPVKQFQPTGNEKVTIYFTLTTAQLNNLIFLYNNGGPTGIGQSEKVSALAATSATNNYNAVHDSVATSVIRLYGAWLTTAKAKWAADTLKSYKPPVKK